MKAEQVIELIRTLEPSEIKKLFVLIKEYETEVHRSRAAVTDGVSDDFKRIAIEVFSKNDELFKKLAEYEVKERKNSAK